MPNYENRYARSAEKKRQQVYDAAMELIEGTPDGINQQAIVDLLRQRYPRNDWSCKVVGGFLKPLVSNGTINRVRKRVLGIMGTYYSMGLFMYEETPTETHDMDAGQGNPPRLRRSDDVHGATPGPILE